MPENAVEYWLFVRNSVFLFLYESSLSTWTGNPVVISLLLFVTNTDADCLGSQNKSILSTKAFLHSSCFSDKAMCDPAANFFFNSKAANGTLNPPHTDKTKLLLSAAEEQCPYLNTLLTCPISSEQSILCLTRSAIFKSVKLNEAFASFTPSISAA